MNFKIIKSNTFSIKDWSGGTTTELFIHPENANYRNRNFDFRISTATVELENSIFTPLPNIKRTLMVLDGQMTLNHSGHHTKKLERFDSDNFDGEWSTSSKGKCTDFNLMTMGTRDGTVESMLLEKGNSFDFSLSDNLHFVVLFVYAGKLKIGKEIADTRDLIIASDPNGSIKLCGIEKCDLIITKLF